MELRLQLIILIGSIVVLTFIINMIKKQKLELKYALSWILADIAVMVLGAFPKIIDVIAKIVGVKEPINVVFFLGSIFLGVIVFSLTVAQSRNSRKLKDLVQKVALEEKYNKDSKGKL